MRELEYADVRKIINFISKSNIYDKSQFLFSSDVDVKNTGEINMRNSFFTYSMVGYCELDGDNEVIEKLALFKTNAMCNEVGGLKLEFATNNERFLNDVLTEITKRKMENNIKCVQIILQRNQINVLSNQLLNNCGFVYKALYKAKDDVNKLDLLLFEKKIEG